MYLNEIEGISTCVTKKELETLHELVKKNKSDVCVEIGSYMGASSIAIASALSESDILYCIDIWLSDVKMRPDPNNSLTLFENFKENTKKYKKDIKPIVDYSYNAYRYFVNVDIKIDFLFVDGDHTVKGVGQDWSLYYSLMRKGGIVVFHDWGWGSVKKMIKDNVMDKTEGHNNLPNMWWGIIK